MGLEELPGLAETTVLVSPNPAQDELRVNIQGKTLNYWEVYNIEGKRLGNYRTSKVSVADYLNGIYIVKIYDTEGNEYVEKMMIIK
ncbi:MAG: T9SS type A sorting domain-containing protein [Chitinophagales bacterium]|nr:T9SS type A sorting domain-containing protein [Chitinophagales bacterium]